MSPDSDPRRGHRRASVNLLFLSDADHSADRPAKGENHYQAYDHIHFCLLCRA